MAWLVSGVTNEAVEKGRSVLVKRIMKHSFGSGKDLVSLLIWTKNHRGLFEK